MNPSNEQHIASFYNAFAVGDAETMAALYHDQVTFSDPAFGTLQGEEVRNMWRMLLSRNKSGIHIQYTDVKANETSGSVNWQASYMFGNPPRKIINKIQASFKFKDGLILEHHDVFNLWTWTQQAFGLPGYLLGWTPMMKNKIRTQTRSLLQKFTEQHNAQGNQR
ncbi:MAG: nuclear transport factor 2 family protein [Saprospiraceae bacterium]|nr:nuclear transport factor 2 family protein [Candidatus Defluviibacterium haderslevense]